MIQIGKTLISEAIIDTDFTCNLSACKGECCVSGDAGAPLDEDERQILKDGTALCGIESAYRDGVISWKKPVSCELYPIRVQKLSELSAVNYDKWDICDDACSLGKELQVPVYKFTKNALVRKFGEDWYQELERVIEEEEH
ncbi:MAG: DUF3109 family protein [Psychroflexus sp.]